MDKGKIAFIVGAVLYTLLSIFIVSAAPSEDRVNHISQSFGSVIKEFTQKAKEVAPGHSVMYIEDNPKTFGYYLAMDTSRPSPIYYYVLVWKETVLENGAIETYSEGIIFDPKTNKYKHRMSHDLIYSTDRGTKTKSLDPLVEIWDEVIEKLFKK